MKKILDRMSMQKRMMIYFAVPLLIIQTAVAAVFYPVLLEKYKNQLDYSGNSPSVRRCLSWAVIFTIWNILHRW